MFGDSRERATDAPETVRVLVVDDSALMRKLIGEMLTHTSGIEVIGTARDGADALAKARSLRPDVITLDVEMPNMNGIEFLETLMPELPTPVVMVSSLTAEGTEVTLACLQRGAVDFVCKPSGSISLDIARRETDIIAKVRAAAKARVRVPRFLRNDGITDRLNTGAFTRPPVPTAKPSLPVSSGQTPTVGTARPTVPASANARPVKPTQRMDGRTVVVAIASSTGGPAALHELIPHLPADLNAAYLLVQHLPAGFTRSLAERLDGQSALKVREAQPGDVPERGLLLFAPGGYHMELDSHGRTMLNEDPPLWGVRPAADVMMRSVATNYKSRAIGVVLTGMGRDGALGAKAIHQAGGFCLAQDEASCVIYGMPRAAVEAGAVNRVVSLSDMASAIAAQITAMTGAIKAA